MAVTVDSIVVIRRSGRPRVEPHASVSAWVPAGTHDRLVKVARSRDVSVSQIVTEAVTRHISLLNNQPR